MTLQECITYMRTNNMLHEPQVTAAMYLEQLQSIFDEMEVMEEFEDAVWIKVSKATLFGEVK